MEKSAEPHLYLDKIESLNASHPDWLFTLVRLGKVYLLLEDLQRVLEQFMRKPQACCHLPGMRNLSNI
jgi:hypothetical protein